MTSYKIHIHLIVGSYIFINTQHRIIIIIIIIIISGDDTAKSVQQLGYRLAGRGVVVTFLQGAIDLSFLHIVDTCSGAHPASYTVGTGGVKLKAHLNLMQSLRKKFYLHSPTRLHAVEFN
jgi:hypothetical protein